MFVLDISGVGIVNEKRGIRKKVTLIHYKLHDLFFLGYIFYKSHGRCEGFEPHLRPVTQ